MAKKGYDVAQRFQEVAKRARETGPIHTGSRAPSPSERMNMTVHEMDAHEDRPGAKMNIPRDRYGRKKDVNLPIDTGRPRLKK